MAALIVIGLVAIGLPLGVVAQQVAGPEQRMAAILNQARVAQGLSALAVNPELTAAAEGHARDMAAKGYMEHESLDGSTPRDRAARQGYVAPPGTAWLVLEVITARATPEAGLNWLLSDRQHRGVVLRGYWREMGIGFVEGGPWGQIWSIKFGCRPNILPAISEPNPSGGTTLRLTNEECVPSGGANRIGRATEVMVSERRDFSGAAWEPFATTRVLKDGGKGFVRYRDGQGRETVSSIESGADAPPVAGLTVSAPDLVAGAPPAATATPSPTPSPSATPSPSPTASPTPSPTAEPTATVAASPTPTATVAASPTPTATVAASPTPTATATPAASPFAPMAPGGQPRLVNPATSFLESQPRP